MNIQGRLEKIALTEHLRELPDGDRESLTERARELAVDGRSQREIANILGVSAMTVNRYLKRTEGETP